MLRFFLTRLAAAVPTLLIIVTASFFLMRFAPGGPFDEAQTLSPAVLANLKHAYGLDQPLWQQYLHYLGSLLHGDFGPSLKYRDYSVTQLISEGLPVTLELGIAALLIALPAGITLGSLAALRAGNAFDQALLALVVLGVAVPSFVLLPFLGLIFGVYLHWLPVAGFESLSWQYLLLPVLALSLAPLAYVARLTRAGMLEVLGSAYIRSAHAKGLPLRLIIVRHALRPALMPVASYLVPAVATILTGSLVVESIAGLPGIGRYLVQGALNRDYTLVLGMVILYSTLLIGMGLLVDLLYAWLDPRLRFRA